MKYGPITEAIPIEDTVCECFHWYEEHDSDSECNAPGCKCRAFVVSDENSTPEAIADRGGDPTLWPTHVAGFFERAAATLEEPCPDCDLGLRICPACWKAGYRGEAHCICHEVGS